MLGVLDHTGRLDLAVVFDNGRLNVEAAEEDRARTTAELAFLVQHHRSNGRRSFVEGLWTCEICAGPLSWFETGVKPV